MITVKIKAINGIRTVAVAEDNNAPTWYEVFKQDAVKCMFITHDYTDCMKHITKIDGKEIPADLRNDILASTVSNNSTAEVALHMYNADGIVTGETDTF